MGGESEKSERGFVVIDRRGEEAQEPQAPPERPVEHPQGPGSLPAVDFSTFVLSLGTSALFHMGLVPEPSTGERVGEPNLPLASQTIDTLAMLQSKTRGNLDEEEGKLLESLLYELRMRFVEAAKTGEAPEGG